jgi:hypothetical protein
MMEELGKTSYLGSLDLIQLQRVKILEGEA